MIPSTSAGRGLRSEVGLAATAWMRLAGLVGLMAALLAVVAAPASAKETHLLAPPPIGSGGSGPGQLALAAPAGIGVNDTTGDIYVADAGNHRVDQFEASGTFVRSFGSFTTPAFVAVDNSSGEESVYAADTTTNTVFKFEADGTLETTWGSGGQLSEAEVDPGVFEAFGAIAGIAVGPGGNLFVIRAANEGGEPTFKFQPDGTLIESFPTALGTGRFGLAVDSAGDIYKVRAAGAVAKLDPSGNLLNEQVDGNGNAGIAVEPGSDDLYVAQKTSVAAYDPSGTLLDTFGAAGDIGQAAGLAVDSAGVAYVADAAKQQIERFNPTIVPDATTEPATEVTRQTATLNATVGAGGGPEAQCIFEYLTEAAYLVNAMNSRFAGASTATCNPPGPFSGSATTAVTASLTGLALETSYRFRVVGTSTNGSDPGEALAFTTAPPVTLTTGEATAVTGDSATLNGTVDPEGVALEECFFEYGTTTAYGQSAPCAETPAEIGSGNVPVPVHADLAGLNGGTEYHFRLAAKNSFGTSKGADAAFRTLGPSVVSESVSAVTADSATLEATLDPNATATTYEFQYVADALFQQSGFAQATGVPAGGASIGAGELEVVRKAQLQGLQPVTTYHFRVVAQSTAGTATGEAKTFSTQATAASLLPDGRVWEMVSPPDKHGSPLEPITEEGGLLQAPASCDATNCAFAYIATGPIDTDPKGTRSPAYVQLLAARAPSGWSTQNITTPNEKVSTVHVGVPSEYKFFAEDLSSSVVEPDGKTPLSPLTTERTPYRREADGEFAPLVTAANVLPGAKFGGGAPNGLEFLTATPDLSHVLLGSTQVLTPGFKSGFEPKELNFYEISGGEITLVSVLPNGRPTAEEGLGAAVGRSSLNMRGAISSDGNRVLFEVADSLKAKHVYLRDVALAQTLQIDQIQPKADGGPGGAEFQAASSDGSKVFFTDASRLTRDSTASINKPDLYMCEVKEREGELTCVLSDLSVDPNPGEAANVQGEVSAIGSSGTHVYFAANGVLTSVPNAHGEKAVPGVCHSEIESTCNLYEYDTATRRLALVAVVSNDDAPDWASGPRPGLGSLTARSSPNGDYFTFMSQRSLTGYDNRDARSGQRDVEVFQYDSKDGALSCISCNPTGARPNAVFDKPGYPGLLVDHAGTWGGNGSRTPQWLAASIPGWTLGPSLDLALYQSRYLDNSGREFFNSSDALVPSDTNGVMDVYEYEPPGVGDCTTASSTYSPTSGGCVGLISSGTSAEESAFLDASESGDDVFFLTQAKLASTDVDNAFDVYDASVGGRTYETVKAVECSGDACQQPAVPPNDATPGSLTFNGAGNVVQCPKGRQLKKGKCVRKQTKKHKKKKAKGKKSPKKSAKSKRGSGR